MTSETKPDAGELAKRLRKISALHYHHVAVVSQRHEVKTCADLDAAADELERLERELSAVNAERDEALQIAGGPSTLLGMANEYGRALMHEAALDAERDQLKRENAQWKLNSDFTDEMTKIDKDEIRVLNSKLAASEKCGMALSANACHNGYGTDGGDHRCEYQDRIKQLESDLASTRAELESLKAANSEAADAKNNGIIPLTKLGGVQKMSDERPKLNLYVVGESSGDPAEWNPYGTYGARILVYAHTPGEAMAIADYPGEAHQVVSSDSCIIAAQFARV